MKNLQRHSLIEEKEREIVRIVDQLITSKFHWYDLGDKIGLGNNHSCEAENFLDDFINVQDELIIEINLLKRDNKYVLNKDKLYIKRKRKSFSSILPDFDQEYIAKLASLLLNPQGAHAYIASKGEQVASFERNLLVFSLFEPSIISYKKVNEMPIYVEFLN
jgi:hypothetical protein